MSHPDASDAGRNGREREERQLALIHRIARLGTQPLPLRQKLQQIVDLLKQHLDCAFVACAAIDLRQGRFRCEALASDLPSAIFVGYGRELGSGVVGEVAVSGRTLHVPDVSLHPNYVETLPGARAELCVPVRYNGETMAVINAEATTAGAFGDCVDLLETVAEQVAGLFAVDRLSDEQRQRVELLGMLSDLSRAAIEADGLDEVLYRIVHFLRDRFRLESVGVLLADTTAADKLRFSAHAGNSVFHGRSGGDWPATLGVIGRAFRSGQAQYVPDVIEDPDYVLGNPAVTCEFVLPVRARGQFLGLLNLEAVDPECLSDSNRQMLAALAEQVSGALHLAVTNARLREINRLVEEKSAALAQANLRLRQANELLERLSHRDGLTGIANRRRFDEMLVTEWSRAQRHGHSLALLMLDIDDFKSYNDGYGHVAGDEALRQVARVLSAALGRGEDCIARYGGEEFAALLPHTTLVEALHVGAHIARALAHLALPHAYSRAAPVLTLSMGAAALVPQGELDPCVLVDQADSALYRAKSQGRNRIETPPISLHSRVANAAK
ncbi:sensor domain-containing diguanylate cyclase [Tahibacter harae]|uniref:diguanylate cyclase n=1 Tax=Tahibacter harae TaxID=2963937 RepID=A0ABT1QSW6_9GAMM|nr:sensor domain-containing diguanylate cyclase [Tahibacter harae]MCQ4165391.1 sensor domain-containing diguanylate cyclase [Tahibacter harae]